MGHFKPLPEPAVRIWGDKLHFKFNGKTYLVNYDRITGDESLFYMHKDHVYGPHKNKEGFYNIGFHVFGGKVWREDLEYNIDDDEAKAAIAHFRTIAAEDAEEKGTFYYVWGG